MSAVQVRRARPDEFGRVGALTLAAYDADGFVASDPDPAFADELADAAARAEHAGALVPR